MVGEPVPWCELQMSLQNTKTVLIDYDVTMIL